MQELEDQLKTLGVESESGQIYHDLGRILLDRASRPAFVTIGTTPELNPLQKVADILASCHNRVVSLNNIYGVRFPGVFTAQDHFESLRAQGLTLLSSDQAQVAIKVLEGENVGKNTSRQLYIHSSNQTKEAVEKNDLPTYLMWERETYEVTKRDLMIDEAIYRAMTGGEFPPLQEYIDEVETKRPRWLAEARLARRMYVMLEALSDRDRIRAAILRMPENIDRARSPRVLTYFPNGSFYLGGGRADITNQGAVLNYCITDAACILHSFDNLYRLTRKQKPDGQFEARAFYVSSYSGEGFNRFLEVSFDDDTSPMPPIRLHNPQVQFTRNPAIEREDVTPNLVVGDEGQLHFILGVDEYGGKITQDLIPYVVDSLVGGVSNAYRIPVGQFFQGKK